MSDQLPKAVLDSADITSISQLILRERESRDRGLWDQMRECFWPDSVVRISWFRGNGPDFVTGSIDMARRGIQAKHRLGPVLVVLAGNRAIASLTGIIDLPVKMQNVEGTLSTHARFLYRWNAPASIGAFSDLTRFTCAMSLRLRFQASTSPSAMGK